MKIFFIFKNQNQNKIKSKTQKIKKKNQSKIRKIRKNQNQFLVSWKIKFNFVGDVSAYAAHPSIPLDNHI